MITSEIHETIAVLSESKGYKKQLCLVSWSGREPCLDLRTWQAGETMKPLKGMTLSKEEAERLWNALGEYLER